MILPINLHEVRDGRISKWPHMKGQYRFAGGMFDLMARRSPNGEITTCVLKYARLWKGSQQLLTWGEGTPQLVWIAQHLRGDELEICERWHYLEGMLDSPSYRRILAPMLDV